jgi:hypothetical protein
MRVARAAGTTAIYLTRPPQWYMRVAQRTGDFFMRTRLGTLSSIVLVAGTLTSCSDVGAGVERLHKTPVAADVQAGDVQAADVITGSGTANTIPQFTSSTSIGDSPIIQSNGNIGIGSTSPDSRLEVFDFRQSGGNANGAVFGRVSCTTGNTQPTCAGVRGDASDVALGAVGVLGDNFASNGGGGSGVLGQAFGVNAYGVRGISTVTSGIGIGVQGLALSADGAAGFFVNNAFGTILFGGAGPSGAAVFRVDGKGTVFADGGFRPFGADFAESMVVEGDRNRYSPGDLLVIDPSGERRLALSGTPYSTLVAGIYSTLPGVLASQHRLAGPVSHNEVPMAVVGIVPCKVTTENGPIAVGDLLVTSSELGRAMRGTDRRRMLGAVVGKALERLSHGDGVIQVLVTLQ